MSTTALVETIDRLSESERARIVALIQTMLKEHPDAGDAPSPANRGYGALKGKIWMSDDFDEPMEEFKEYM